MFEFVRPSLGITCYVVPDEKPSSDEEEEEEGEGEEGKGEEGEGEKEEGDGGKGTEPQAGGETATLSSGDVPVEAEPNQKSQTDEAVTSSNGEAGGDAPATNEVEEDKEEESDLQIAWEVLELARVICQK